MGRILVLLILAATITAVLIFAVYLILPVLAFLAGLGVFVGLLVFLRRLFPDDDDQDLSHPE